MQAMNALDQLQPVDGMGPVGEIRLVPDLESFRALPYAPNTGAVLVDQVALDRQAGARLSARLPRTAGGTARRARRVARGGVRERVHARGADRRGVPSGRREPVLLDDRDDRVPGLRRRPRRCARAAAHPARAVLRGARPRSAGDLDGSAPAVRAADQQLLVRETIRGVAARLGYVASLAPKPWPDAAGNGCHVHFSLWSTGDRRNLFHDPSRPDRLSADARHFVAGVLAHLPGLCGLTAPSFNSYARLTPQSWAGAYGCWGHDNREAPVRVPSVFQGMEERSTNVELKAADASCNPYLAVGGLIAAGLDGVERSLEPPEPVEVDPAALDRARAGRTWNRPPARLTGRGARRARRGRGAPRCARPRARRVVPRRPPFRVACLCRAGRRRSGPRALPQVLMELGELALVDHHAHGILLDRPTLEEFRGRFSESPDPRQWPHVANSVTYRRAIRSLAAFFDLAPTEEAVHRHRLESDPPEYAARLLRATRTELLLVDDGYPPPDEGTSVGELGAARRLRGAARLADRACRGGGGCRRDGRRPPGGGDRARARLRGAQDDRRLPRRAGPRRARRPHRGLDRPDRGSGDGRRRARRPRVERGDRRPAPRAGAHGIRRLRPASARARIPVTSSRCWSASARPRSCSSTATRSCGKRDGSRTCTATCTSTCR